MCVCVVMVCVRAVKTKDIGIIIVKPGFRSRSREPDGYILSFGSRGAGSRLKIDGSETLCKTNKTTIMLYFVVLEIYGNWATKVGKTRRRYRK